MEEREQQITEHIAELRRRVMRIVILALILISLFFYFSPLLIHRFWSGLIDEKMFVYTPTEWIILRLVFSLILSMLVLYPYTMFELYLFAKPGLFESERKFLKRIIIPSYLIFLAGCFLSYKFLVPFLYSFSSENTFYSVEKTTLNALKLSFTFGFLLQIPLIVFLLDRLRIIDYQTLKNLRLLIYFVLIALVFNSPISLGGLTQIAIIVLFLILFELSLFFMSLSKR